MEIIAGQIKVNVQVSVWFSFSTNAAALFFNNLFFICVMCYNTIFPGIDGYDIATSNCHLP